MLGEVNSQNKEYHPKDFDEEGAMRLLRALKIQTVQDYIIAVEHHDKNTIRECETFLTYCGKLETARYAVRFIVPLFRCEAMEHIPDEWGTEDYETFKCPICNVGKARINYNEEIHRKGYTQWPYLRYICSNCGYSYEIPLYNTTEEELKIVKRECSKKSYEQRMRCYKEEFEETLKKNDYTPQERDDLARRLADKWKV